MVYKQFRESNTVRMRREKFVQKADQILKKLDNELKFHEMGHGNVGNVVQIEIIKVQVQNMQKALSLEKFEPDFQRFIIDSWDFSNPLGNALLDLIQFYSKL